MKSLLNLFFWSFFSTCMWHTQSSLGNEGWQVHLQRCQRDHCRLRRLQGMCDGVMRMKSRYYSYSLQGGAGREKKAILSAPGVSSFTVTVLAGYEYLKPYTPD